MLVGDSGIPAYSKSKKKMIMEDGSRTMHGGRSGGKEFDFAISSE